jgi:hypothetical protein
MDAHQVGTHRVTWAMDHITIRRKNTVRPPKYANIGSLWVDPKTGTPWYFTKHGWTRRDGGMPF